jgi:hypothetical protein
MAHVGGLTRVVVGSGSRATAMRAGCLIVVIIGSGLEMMVAPMEGAGALLWSS